MKNENLNSKKNKVVKDLFSKRYEYPSSEDIYNQSEKEPDIDPEDISKKKEFIILDKEPHWHKKKINQDKSGSDLDIPGSELDDEQENLGSEDEENNFYSIGGDNHNNLEENHNDLEEDKVNN